MRRALIALIVCSACTKPNGDPSARTPTIATDASTPVGSSSAAPIAIRDAAADAPSLLSLRLPPRPAWVAAPFEGLPERPASGRDVDVIVEVTTQRRPDGLTSPVRLLIPDSGVKQELFDDQASQPACGKEQDAARGALFVTCNAADGVLRVRAYQEGDELVVDVDGEGDVMPTLSAGRHRFKMPRGSRARYVTHLTTKLAPNPGSGAK